MIDTIVLLIPSSCFEIIDADAFSPSAKFLVKQAEHLFKNGDNTASSKAILLGKAGKSEYVIRHEKGSNKPRITLTARKLHHTSGGVHRTSTSIAIKVECSLPKLMFGNNFNELSDSHFDSIIDRLHKELSLYIKIDKNDIKKASIPIIHYGKNILLTDGSTPSFVIRTLERANIARYIDKSQTEYRNEGSLVRYRTNSYELCFYDKLKDLEQSKKSEKKAFEKNSTSQVHILDKIPQNTQILRMEVRLCNKSTISNIFKRPLFMLMNTHLKHYLRRKLPELSAFIIGVF